MADPTHGKGCERGTHILRPHHLAGMACAGIARLVHQPEGWQVLRLVARLVACHAEADDIGMWIGTHHARHGERTLRSEMTQANRDDAADDARLALGALDALRQAFDLPG